MKYTFQQRKYVFNRLLNAITSKIQELNTTQPPNLEFTKRVAMTSRTIESQLLKSSQTFTFPKRYAAKVNRILDEVEKLEEDMFLADAPELKKSLDKLQAKIGGI